ncbi:hypothetical protein Nepgr_015807 [Nepenthes gracilis]|uniref:Uncharacterized protein n=1 Tax=Nepenthes gracilis TaxID=150966 RepID=A0AAD3XRM6_NEPGR|nr:hypothetical protein Nepgr_015807 [Nepenthes gracilis]
MATNVLSLCFLLLLFMPPSCAGSQSINATSSSPVENLTSDYSVGKPNRDGGDGGSGGWRYSWGWGGGGGGGGGDGGHGWGWGWGGGGGGQSRGWWRWGCRAGREGRRLHHHGRHRKRKFRTTDYQMGEFAECKVMGRCHFMRLDCPHHCGRACFYDCRDACEAHCLR